MFILILGGCYDYKELNDMSIVSGIGIDFIDNEYLVSLEITKSSKDGSSTEIETKVVTGSDSNISIAFSNAMNMIFDPFGGNQPGTSSVTGVDINQLGQLKNLLLDIRAAVDAKTQAFEEEYVTVDNVVDSEITSLQSLNFFCHNGG